MLFYLVPSVTKIVYSTCSIHAMENEVSMSWMTLEPFIGYILSSIARRL